MHGSGHERPVGNQWLEDAWRHGEVVVDREGGMVRVAVGRTMRARLTRRSLQRLLESTPVVGRALRRA